MKRILTLVLLAGLLVAAPAAEWQGDVIRLSKDEAEECRADGSCVVFTKKEFDAVLRAQRSIVLIEAAKACVFGGVGHEL